MARLVSASFCFIFFILSSGRCLSQENYNPQPAMRKDVLLSITLATNVFQLGSSSGCKSTLSNSSTNTIDIDPTSPNKQMSQLSVYLTDDSGKYYRLTPKYSAYLGVHPSVEVKPSQNITEAVVLKFDGDIKSGGYTLNALRIFRINDSFFVTVANPVKIQVKQN